MSKENKLLQMQWGAKPMWQEVLTCTKKHELGWLKGEMEVCWRDFAPDLKYNCKSKKMGRKIADTLRKLYVVLDAMFPSLWSWENLASFLLVVSLCLFLFFLRANKSKPQQWLQNPGLLNQ